MKNKYILSITSSILFLSLITACGKSETETTPTTTTSANTEITAAADIEIPTETPSEAPTITEMPTEPPTATEAPEVPTEDPTSTPEATATPTEADVVENQPTATATPTPTSTDVAQSQTTTEVAQAQPTVAEVQPTAAQTQAVAEQPQPTAVAEQPQTTPAPTQAAAQSQSVSSMSFDDKCDASYNTRGELAPHSTVYVNGVAYEYCGKNPANGTTIDDPKWYNHPEACLMSADEIYAKCWTYEEDPATGTLKQTRHDDWMEDADMRDYRFYWVIQCGGDYDGYYD